MQKKTDTETGRCSETVFLRQTLPGGMISRRNKVTRRIKGSHEASQRRFHPFRDATLRRLVLHEMGRSVGVEAAEDVITPSPSGSQP